jgi:glutamate-1-semialdehyde 2,1-aminomutase
MHFARIGSLFWMSLHDNAAPRDAAPLTNEAAARFSALFHAMLARGVYLPPSAYEACFLSLAHTSADIRKLAQALQDSLTQLA